MEDKNFKFAISEEMIEKADSYIPLEKKVSFAKVWAEQCLEEVEISLQKMEADTLLALPPVWQEKTMIKQVALMYGFLSLYLHIEVPDDFGVQAYNKFGRWHPFNQMERLKTNPRAKDKVFDIIDDFKELKKFLDIEIYNLRMARNDGWTRALAGISTISSPEAVKALSAEMEKLTATIEKGKKTAKQTRKVEAPKKANEGSNAQS